MDKATAADLDRHLTTEPSGLTQYSLDEVPVIQGLILMFNSPASPDDWEALPEGNDERRAFIYKYYQANDMAKSLFSIGWERGVERQQLRLIEASEVDEVEELDPDEANWHYLFGYVAGQVASYEEWDTPYSKDQDDEFFDEVDAEENSES